MVCNHHRGLNHRNLIGPGTDMSETTGLCACGCGKPTRPAPETRSNRGWVKGQPLQFLKGHNNLRRGPEARSWASKAEFLAANLYEPVVARFWAKVSKDGPVPPHRPELGPCWLWMASRNARGYGNFSVGLGVASRQLFCAHRVAVALDGRLATDDQDVCHHCDNPRCVRPDHLFLGTRKENMEDMVAKGRQKKPSPTCGRGHLLDESNTYVYVSPGSVRRICIACRKDRHRDTYVPRGKRNVA